MHELSNRLKRLPPYLFAEIDRQKGEMRRKKIAFIDVSIGDPDILAPSGVVASLSRTAKSKANQKYALDQGKVEFRQAIQKWFRGRFGVSLDATNHILPLLGSKEGLVHFPLAFVNPGDYVLVPSPGYPGYWGAAFFAGAKTHEMPLLEENGFLPDLRQIPLAVRKKAKLMYLNYPNNPTTALAPRAFLKDVVTFCARYGIILAYDNAYSEIYFSKKPLSILQIPGAKEVALEFHSLSKTFCMTGFRVGWACGSPALMRGLFKVKTNVDSGIFGSIQDAARIALQQEAGYVAKLRKQIKARRDFFVKGLRQNGFKTMYADSTFYVWVKLPQGYNSSIAFAKHLLDQKRIVATPGVGFGRHGEGFIRFALTVDKNVLRQALTLLH